MPAESTTGGAAATTASASIVEFGAKSTAAPEATRARTAGSVTSAAPPTPVIRSSPPSSVIIGSWVVEPAKIPLTGVCTTGAPASAAGSAGSPWPQPTSTTDCGCPPGKGVRTVRTR